MSVNLKQHFIYSKSPELFMKEQWLTFNAFKKYDCTTNINPFDYQVDCLNTIHSIDHNIIVKSRQMGISSMIGLYIAWYMLFNENKEIVILANSREGGIRILKHIKIILQNYSVNEEKDGKIIKHYFNWEDDFQVNNQTELKLTNGCRVKVIAPSRDAGRGYAIDFLYIDEAAFIKNLSDIWPATMNILAKKSKLILSSTPKDNSFFNQLFIQNTDLNKIKLHWSLNPVFAKGLIENTIDKSPYRYSSEWFDELVKYRFQNNQNQVEQELECIIRFQEETFKEKTISLRIDNNMFNLIQNKLKKSESTSDYIRKLIEKDLKN